MSNKLKNLEIISRGKQHKFEVGSEIEAILGYEGENVFFIVHYAMNDRMSIFKNPFVVNKM